MKNIKEMGWEEFLQEFEDNISVETDPFKSTPILEYSDDEITVSVVIEKEYEYPDIDVWEDEALAKELQALVIEKTEE